MKRSFLSAVVLLLLTSAVGIADIQDPIYKRYGKTRKLGRAISNILYGFTEIPMSMIKIGETDGANAEWSYGVVTGVKKAAVRFGYGVYELITWPIPTHLGGYRPAIPRKNYLEPFYGYTEFPPQLGWISETKYIRQQQD